MPEERYCNDHAWCKDAIQQLRKTDEEQWTKMNENKKQVDDKMDAIFTRINVILGSLALACVLLIINLCVKGIV